ncbi:UNVERIFIED_CONTAM: Serine/threonine-protein kinase fray2 [Sesamum radiatum]|uniref:Serine/threonine-protein kinase fray2 n=1 Tax=Sesamum radiatum TaxID=300843 RepID=A0AAW2JPD0_SESRA
MSLINHPNVIKAFCSFVVDHNLWVVMPFMAEGSCLHLMKIAYPEGFEESAIGSVLKETLKALEYLHRHGHIHRDVKAGNILMDSDGEVKLADFGVSACMFDRGDRQRSRNTFVGTPCWMAPEVLQPGAGYDFKADIWSFGITALELAHGHAPFSKYPPMKVLLMTIQNAPPGLDYDRDKRFSKLKDAAQLALKRMPSAEQEAISQSEYQRGVSAWNFDIEDLKLQASLSSTFLNKFMLCLLPREKANGNEVLVAESQTKKEKVYESDLTASDNQGKNGLKKSASKAELLPPMVEKDAAQAKTKHQTGRPRQTQSGPLMPGTVLSHSLSERTRKLERCEIDDNQVAEKAQQVRRAPSFSGPLNLPNRASANSLSAPIKSSGGFKDSLEDKSKTNLVQIKGRFSVTSENVDLVKDIPLSTVSRRNSQGSPLRKSASVGNWIFDSKQMSYSSWFQPHSQPPKEFGNSNVPASILMPHLQNLFQQTSIQQDLIMNLLSSLQTVELENDLAFYEKSFPMNLWLEILFVIPYYLMLDYNCGLDRAFRFYYVQSSAQKLPSFGVSCVVCIHDFEILIMLMLAELIVSERERMLLMKISELQARMNSLTDELTAEKLKYMQLQQRLNAVSAREEDGDRREGDS